jgi:FkbM family methyltransferase
MRTKDVLRTVGLGLEPTGLQEFRAARGYARQHRLSGGPLAQLVGHRRAVHVGLHLLPAGYTLDGFVLDIGANRGDFAAVVRQMEPRSRVVCVEPGPDTAAALARRFAADGNVRVHAVAASDRVGTATLNVTDSSKLTSLHSPAEVLSEYGGSAVIQRPTVATSTIDTLVDEDVRLLKIDVQGHEAAALRGAEKTLRRTAAAIIEVLFVSHYEGDALFGEIDGLMRAAGFVLMALDAPSNPRHSLKWGDACYVKR